MAERESGSEKTGAPSGDALWTAATLEVSGPMKSVFKRFLLFGMSLAVVTLLATQSWETAESDPDPGSGPDPSNDPEAQRQRSVAPTPFPNPTEPRSSELRKSVPVSEDGAIAFRPLAGITVTFSGKVIRAGSRFALRETAGVLYILDSAGRAWAFEGEDVRVTGKLDTSTRLLHIDDIQSMVA